MSIGWSREPLVLRARFGSDPLLTIQASIRPKTTPSGCGPDKAEDIVTKLRGLCPAPRAPARTRSDFGLNATWVSLRFPQVSSCCHHLWTNPLLPLCSSSRIDVEFANCTVKDVVCTPLQAASIWSFFLSNH
eukprot:3582891-Pleurochrysis_carterae.AAC.1